ncbi:MAG: hypothetical protein B7X12_10550 [Halothiobacillus sp. 20-53-49]|nr:MAG: hypothetical protein B7X12_10550 [Halothiobacillus sp. 20-53-49]OYY56894.1 MAG: hypothetical protein B7Y53_00780 [Halothiobacillus sp. 28-55-5]
MVFEHSAHLAALFWPIDPVSFIRDFLLSRRAPCAPPIGAQGAPYGFMDYSCQINSRINSRSGFAVYSVKLEADAACL